MTEQKEEVEGGREGRGRHLQSRSWLKEVKAGGSGKKRAFLWRGAGSGAGCVSVRVLHSSQREA